MLHYSSFEASVESCSSSCTLSDSSADSMVLSIINVVECSSSSCTLSDSSTDRVLIGWPLDGAGVDFYVCDRICKNRPPCTHNEN